ncbi:AT-hook motif nuclear-localized protein 28-like [Vicia villosa]|uniref:AT-hook motif nuclear-localized protein 28-like n=1 Tax=Vicia villosa TaxID=3911 RepID=UPI00273A8721|nr:AT-hook motif nuclear-localized protein 28-like [Vicia villosa]
MATHITSTTTNNNYIIPTPTPTQLFPRRNNNLPIDSRDFLAPSSSRKPKGRPLGSKNKPKPPVVIEGNPNMLMEPVFIQIPAGNDVVETLINLARTHQANITVLSGSGLVSNVTILHPISRAPTFPIKATLHMISISGTYLNANSVGISHQFIADQSRSSFSIYFCGDRRQVHGGIIGGKIEAVGVVSIRATLFKNPGFHRVAIVNGVFQEIEGNDTMYNGGVIPNADRATYGSTNNVMGSSSAQPDYQMLHPSLPPNVNLMQWNRNRSTRNDTY